MSTWDCRKRRRFIQHKNRHFEHRITYHVLIICYQSLVLSGFFILLCLCFIILLFLCFNFLLTVTFHNILENVFFFFLIYARIELLICIKYIFWLQASPFIYLRIWRLRAFLNFCIVTKLCDRCILIVTTQLESVYVTISLRKTLLNYHILKSF